MKDINEIRDDVLKIEADAKKRRRFNRIGRYPAGIIFAALASILFYGFTFLMDSKDPTSLEALQRVPLYSSLWKFYEGIFGSGIATFIGSLAVAVIVPIVWIIIAAIITIPYSPKASEAKGESDLEVAYDTAAHISRAEYCYQSDGGVLVITSILCICFNLVSIILTMIQTEAGEKISLGNIIAMVLVAILMLIGTLIADIILSVPMGIFSAVIYRKKKTDAASATVREVIIAEENAEKAKKAAEKKQRKQEAEKAKEIADKKKQETAAELYEKAVKESNDDLMRKAAELGHPDAAIYISEMEFVTLTTEALTKAEKDALKEKIRSYLDKHKDTRIEANFILCMVDCAFESHNMKEWESLLVRVREMKKSGDLPEKYHSSCDMLLDNIVSAIDEIDRKIKEQPKQITIFVPMGGSTSSSYKYDKLEVTGFTHWVTGETLYRNPAGEMVTKDGTVVDPINWDGGEPFSDLAKDV